MVGEAATMPTFVDLYALCVQFYGRYHTPQDRDPRRSWVGLLAALGKTYIKEDSASTRYGDAPEARHLG